MKLDHAFYCIAAQPLRGTRDVGVWLNSVHCQRLAWAFEAGIKKVAEAARVDPTSVITLLPVAETNAAAWASAEHQRLASEVWRQHEGSLAHGVSKVVAFLVEDKLGLEGTGVGDFITHIGGGFLRDARLAGPMKDLSTSLGVYEQWLRRCAYILAADPSLQQAHARARRRRALLLVSALGTAMVMVACLIAWWIVDAQPAPSIPTAATAIVAPPEVPVAQPPAPSAPTATPVGPKARPVAPPPKAPTGSAGTGSAVTPPSPPAHSRTACLQACVGRCQDDADCERNCAGGCPR